VGRAKEEWMRYQDEHWAPIDDERSVCQECFEDHAIQRFIVARASGIGCDFCEDHGSHRRKSIELNAVIEFIAEAILREYGDPAGVLPWDSEEGGYMFDSEMMSADELIMDLVDTTHDEILELIISAFDEGASWVHSHALHGSPSETMNQLWTQFAESVMFEKRFFFPRASKTRVKNSHREPEQPADILNAISRQLKNFGLFVSEKKGLKIFRARSYQSNSRPPFDLKNFGVPDRETSMKFANRMSPAGIPIFYGSEDADTAIAEVSGDERQVIKVATFETNRKLQILDLTEIPPQTSIFDGDDWHTRQIVRFLNSFRYAIMKKVDRVGTEHVEYIPSQIFTEFIRCRVKHLNNPIDGIAFPSVHTKKKNYALFCDNGSIVDINGKSDTEMLLRLLALPGL
jgi:hypothetical protein